VPSGPSPCVGFLARDLPYPKVRRLRPKSGQLETDVAVATPLLPCDPRRHRQDAGLDRTGHFRLMNFAFAERFEPSHGPDRLCGRRRLVGLGLRSWTIPASRLISGPRRVFDMGQSSRRVRSASRESRMLRSVFPPNRPSGLAHRPHLVSMHAMPARWVMIGDKKQPNLGISATGRTGGMRKAP
jgi:hypothetical protein